MILHEDTLKIKEWNKVCIKNKHFQTPMYSKDYTSLYKKIMPNYEK